MKPGDRIKLAKASEPIGEAYETEHQIVICGIPPAEDDAWPDDDPRRHNCDAMGCGNDHVLYRFTKPRRSGFTLLKEGE